MLRAAILLADGFETVEALTPYDVFKRTHEIDPLLVSTRPGYTVTSSQGVRVEAVVPLELLLPNEIDFIVLPGGKKGVDNLLHSEAVLSFLQKAHSLGKNIHAICAAPSILLHLGLLNGKKYTCFPGFENPGPNYTGDEVTVDKGTVTGRSMGFSLPFAEAIVTLHCGKETMLKTRPGTRGLK